MKRAGGDESLTEFSLEAIKDKLNNGCELWAVRLPQSFGKLRYLNDVKISLPDHADGSTSASSEKLADFEHKKKNYEVYSLTNNTDDVSNIGAGEMHNMTALLASKRRKYTSVPIQRHLIIKQKISFPPEIRPKADGVSGYVRHEQPEGLLGFFKPAGFESDIEQAKRKRQRTGDEGVDSLPPPLPAPLPNSIGDETSADLSVVPASPSKEERKRLKKEKKEKKEEKKKRKSEASTSEV